MPSLNVLQKNSMNQKTLKNSYYFEGKGLHTGTYSHMTVRPAPAGNGICFCRTDLPGQPRVKALAEHVSNTARSTTLSHDGAEVITVEHIRAPLVAWA